MKNKLTLQIITACMIVFAMTFGVVLAVLANYYSHTNREELKERAAYLSSVLNAGSWEFLENMEHSDHTRITLISEDGTVLYDSQFPAETLSDHSTREEIQEALQSGTGESFRYSESLSRRTINYAMQLDNGTILRLSMLQNTVLELLVNLLNPMMVVVLLAIFLSIWLASRFSKSLIQPINSIDIENPDTRFIYEEMRPFLHRIMAQNKQIYKQMEELQEEHSRQDAMRREFTANVSHELKTPLTSISGFAEIIRDGFVKMEDIPHFADNIYKEAQRLIILVNDILKLSRLEEGMKIEDDMTDVELLSLCQEVTERLQLHAKKQNVTLTCDGTPSTIRGIRNMLDEIICNVCDNAIKYNHSGGTVSIHVSHADTEVCVQVKDTGIGIPTEDLDRIFERFYRVNKSHSKEVGGTGLGLSIVKHGMAFHNARITLNSEEGRGTEVCLYFPKKKTSEN